MIKQDREAGRGEELQKPCHYLFDLTVQDPRGGYTSAYDLQVETADLVPGGATNVRPIREGEVIKTTYNFADPKHPKPVRYIHSHAHEEDRSVLGYKWTGHKEEPLPFFEAIQYKVRNPIVWD